MQKYLIHLVFICLLLCACNHQQTTNTPQAYTYTTDSLRYAQHFCIQQASNHTLLTLYSPWQKGHVLGRYYLIPHDSIATPTNGHRIVVPLEKVCIQSAPHVGYIDALNQTHKVIGACSPQLLYSPIAQQRYQQNLITHLGDAYQMRLEKIKQIAPQALLTTAYPQGDNQTQRLQNDLIIIPTTEWAEPNVLARAEWIKIYGLLFGCTQQADSIFQYTVDTYQKYATLAKQATSHPSIMSGLPYKDTWYMPGGQSFMGQLLQDANIHYHYAQNTETSSLPLSFETVWYHFGQADIWIGIDADTQEQLLQMDVRLGNFKAFKNKKLYHYRKRTNATGGNDFWESAMVYPHRLLQDLITITHPHLLPSDSCFYIGPVL